MTEVIRTRFAPSPTGYLHIGGARTALFAWLYARHHNGQFILRIEDTDRERSTDASIQAILDGMNWLGLDYDEGPFYQTQRFDRYAQVIEQWLSEGHAYRCYCSKERLEALREGQMSRKEKPRYDGACRDLNAKDAHTPHVIRFKNPFEGDVVIDDLIRGQIVINNAELDDLIIARTDGTPTYNFCVVVDDWDMRITDVIRGDDHINNTPRQINMLKALGATVPRYAHVPMILGGDGKRLSKRHGAVSVLQFKEEGYLPQALINYLVRLGWSRGDQEIFSIEELIQYFGLSAVNRSPAAFNQEKLDWINQQYMKTSDRAVVVDAFGAQLTELNIDYQYGPALTDVIALQAEKVKTLKEMAEKSRYFFEETVVYDADAFNKQLTAETLPVLQYAKAAFESLNEWNKESIHQVIVELTEKTGLKMGKIGPPLRVAVTGSMMSPSLDATLQLIGKARVLARIEQVISMIGNANLHLRVD